MNGRTHTAPVDVDRQLVDRGDGRCLLPRTGCGSRGARGRVLAIYRFWYTMSPADKPLRWMIGTLRTPPVGQEARVEAGFLLRRLQRGEMLGMPRSRPMHEVSPRVHELRVDDGEARRSWRILYRIDPDAILVVHWFEKRTQTTPRRVTKLCKKRLEEYDRG